MFKAVINGTRILQNDSLHCAYVRYLRFQTLVCSCNLSQRLINSVNRVATNKRPIHNHISFISKYPFSTTETNIGTLNKNEFETRCNETLESLCEYFEEITEKSLHLKGCDVSYSDGVLTVHFGNEHGTYVINRQTPNQQIWLSSPTSGPKRYDYNVNKKTWIYKHDSKSLHELLQEEIPNIVKIDVNFFDCAHAS